MGEFHLCCRELGHVAERDGDGSDSTASAASTELVRPFSNRSRRRRILGNCRLLNPGIRSSNRVFLQLSRIEGRQAFGFDPMCIAVFLWRCHPLYRFFLLHNRDEYHGRSSVMVEWGGRTTIGRERYFGWRDLACLFEEWEDGLYHKCSGNPKHPSSQDQRGPPHSVLAGEICFKLYP
ncbi:hypothetical protein SAY87_008572 [Trapa incisa]|uniref:Uncharacterized protein n=1 Tax=Trapa incisa TaxID=236973 RepID=A0AAN7JTV6_9MYRT|nr:hypothetical protein SAY87_008572 [Trapa incisa]